MGLRAVVFDYGMVLTGLPDQAAHDAMVRITGLPEEQFEKLYWADRHAYDEGKLSGITFWQKLLRDGGLELGDSAVAELNHWDARMWTSEDPAMVAWQGRLKERGLLTGILSNMGDSVLESIKREFDWLERFDVQVWSYQLHLAKPDPEIYLYTLQKLGTRADETLFIDDKRENVEAALELGMKSIQYSTIERLRGDLIGAGLEAELPLPD